MAFPGGPPASHAVSWFTTPSCSVWSGPGPSGSSAGDHVRRLGGQEPQNERWG